MTDSVPSARSTADEQRRSILQGFLWTLLAVLAIAITVVIVVESPAALVTSGLGNVILALGIGLALWLNHVNRTSVALTIVIVMVLLGTSLPVLAGGLAANERQLTLYFLPLVLAGLTGDRRALYVTVATSVAVVLAAALGVTAGGADEAGRR